jgi:hypothetical protein
MKIKLRLFFVISVFVIILLGFLSEKKHYEKCALPCILELEPNRITLIDVVRKLESKEIKIYDPKVLSNGKVGVEVELSDKDQNSSILLKFEEDVFTDYFLFSNDNFFELSIKDLFNDYGKPTKILINYRPQEAKYWITYVYVIYENKNFGVTYTKNNGIPTDDGILFCFDDYPLIYNFNNLNEQNENMKARALSVPMETIEIVTNYDVNSFYDYVLESNQVCIDIYRR